LYRTNSSIVKKNIIQKMAKAGCFDCFGITRKLAFTYYQDIRTKANKYASEAERSGVNDFDRLNGFKYDRPELKDEFTLQEILQGESETLGECISGTVNDMYGGFFTNAGVTTFNKLKKFPNKYTVSVEAVVSDIKLAKVKTGKTAGKIYGKLLLTDINNDNVKLIIWPQQWERCKDRIEMGTPIRSVCRINIWNGSVDLELERLEKVGVKK
jgi:DNA polymerase III alpha subunit